MRFTADIETHEKALQTNDIMKILLAQYREIRVPGNQNTDPYLVDTWYQAAYHPS